MLDNNWMCDYNTVVFCSAEAICCTNFEVVTPSQRCSDEHFVLRLLMRESIRLFDEHMLACIGDVSKVYTH